MTGLKQDDDRKPNARYGRWTTRYSHYTLILDGIVQEETERNGTPRGSAFIGYRCWASSPEEALEMAGVFAKEFAFVIARRLLWETEPARQPCGIPFGYDFQLTPYSPGSFIALTGGDGPQCER
jgi:hypothetical protein